MKRNMSRTVKEKNSKKFHCSILKLCRKQKFHLIGEQTVAARNDVTTKKVASGLFPNL